MFISSCAWEWLSERSLTLSGEGVFKNPCICMRKSRAPATISPPLAKVLNFVNEGVFRQLEIRIIIANKATICPISTPTLNDNILITRP